MATISSGIAMDANIMNLKEISLREVRPEVSTLMVGGENMVREFLTSTARSFLHSVTEQGFS